ncbi:DUF3284 domain-containing protein [Lactobacillus kalixensis]|uniref:DUF3284 domain-containing protein n=1 Tax=Lactobacillus kalixensis DSM 16043 TaxID=1423763 RepID=A0A0R1UCZ8_9LACO|nr:hypothetical protein FC46_GL000601 [Lactobacillus kalixensis DSM 16043]
MADFFNYLDQQLITAIKQARGNDLPVNLQSGTRYDQNGIKTEITQYKRGELYEADFHNDRFHIVISYRTQDIDKGVKIIFSENIKSYDESKHGWVSNLLYNLQLKFGAKKELKRMAQGVKANMAA